MLRKIYDIRETRFDDLLRQRGLSLRWADLFSKPTALPRLVSPVYEQCLYDYLPVSRCGGFCFRTLPGVLSVCYPNGKFARGAVNVECTYIPQNSPYGTCHFPEKTFSLAFFTKVQDPVTPWESSDAFVNTNFGNTVAACMASSIHANVCDILHRFGIDTQLFPNQSTNAYNQLRRICLRFLNRSVYVANEKYPRDVLSWSCDSDSMACRCSIANFMNHLGTDFSSRGLFGDVYDGGKQYGMISFGSQISKNCAELNGIEPWMTVPCFTSPIEVNLFERSLNGQRFFPEINVHIPGINDHVTYITSILPTHPQPKRYLSEVCPDNTGDFVDLKDYFDMEQFFRTRQNPFTPSWSRPLVEDLFITHEPGLYSQFPCPRKLVQRLSGDHYASMHPIHYPPGFGPLTPRTARHEVGMFNDTQQAVANMNTVSSKAIPLLDSLNTLVADCASGSASIPGMIQHVDDAAVGLTDVSQNLSEVVRDSSSLLKQIREVIEPLLKAAPIAVSIHDAAWIIYDVILAFVNKSIAAIPSLIARFLRLFAVSSDVISDFSSWIAGIFTSEVTAGARREAGEHPFFDVFVSSMFVAFCGFCPTSSFWKSFLLGLRGLPSFLTLSKSIYGGWESIFECLPQCIKDFIAYMFPKDWFQERMKSKDVIEWIAEVDSLSIHLANPNTVVSSVVIQQRIRKAHDFKEALLKETMTRNCKIPKAMSQLRGCFENIKQLKEIIDKMTVGANFRQTPYSISFYGNPGVGKSHLTSIVIADLAPKSVPDNMLMYTRRYGNKFWDAYQGQFATVFEDFGSTTELEEYTEFQEVVSSVPLVVPMASLAEKGRMFSSELIVSSANIPYPDCGQHKVKKAIWRRRNLFFSVRVHPNYRISNIDHRLNPALVDKDDLTFPQYQFSLLNPIEPDPDPLGDRRNWFAFPEMMTMVRAGFIAHKEVGNKAESQVNSFRKIILENRTDDQDDQLSQGSVWRRAEHEVGSVSSETSYATAQDHVDSLDDIYARVTNPTEYTEHIREVEFFFQHQTDEEEVCIVSPGNHWKTVGKVLAGLAISALSAFALYRMYKWFSPTPKRACTPQVAFGGKYPDDESTGRSTPMSRLNRSGKYQAQIVPPSVGEVTNSLLPALGTIFVTNESGAVRYASVLAIGGRVFMCNKHVLFGKENAEFESVHVSLAFEAEKPILAVLDPEMVTEITGKDLVLFSVFNCRNFKNIVSHFPEQKVIAKIKETDGFLLTRKVRSQMINSQNVHLIATDEVIEYDDGPAVKREHWMYTASTDRGDCGSLLIDGVVARGHKILGIHHGNTTGLVNNGLGMIVTREDVETAAATINKATHQEGSFNLGPVSLKDLSFDDTGAPRIRIYGDLDVLGVVPPSLARLTPPKTDLMHSPLYGIIPTTVGPSVLSRKDPRLEVPVHPGEIAVNKYGKNVFDMPWKDVQEAGRDVFEIIDALPDKMERKVLDDWTTLNGVDDFDPIKMDTSPGFPYVCTRPPGTKGSEYLVDVSFDDDGRKVYKFIDNELQRRFREREEKAKKGERCSTIWIDSLKDEKRALEKIAQGKTRTFSIPPKEYVLLFRKYFGAFAQNMYSNGGEFFSLVGANIYSAKCDLFIRRMKEVGTNFFGGDFKAWDGTLLPGVMRQVCHIINEYYDDGPENRLVREVLFEDVFSTVHLFENVVFLDRHGIPSGVPITLLINSFSHAIYSRCAFMNLVPKPYNTMYYYNLLVRESFVGDDDLYCVHDSIIHYFNLATMSDYYAKSGLEYTSPNKGKVTSKFGPLDEWTYLKNTFRWTGSMWLPRLDETSIGEMLNWVRKSESAWDSVMLNANTALRFAYFYGEEYFNNLRRKIVLKAKKNKRRFSLCTYSEIDDWFVSGNFDIMETRMSLAEWDVFWGREAKT